MMAGAPQAERMVHDFVQRVDDLRADRRSFYVSPRRWRTCRISSSLAWSEVKFSKHNEPSIPKKRGVYAFVVRHENGRFPAHGFIMYVGITGQRSTARTLHARYRDYLREREVNKRPKVHYMLRKYEDDLHFSFVAFDDPAIDLGELELDLNDALLPPVVMKDFTAEIRSLVRAIE